jgi:hypothetical protein
MIIEIGKVGLKIGLVKNMRETVKGEVHCEFESMSCVAVEVVTEMGKVMT